MNNQQTNVGVGYERKDIRFGCLLAVIVAAVCIMAVIGYGVWRFFWWEEATQAVLKRSVNPLSPGLRVKLPPEPRLEQLDRMAGLESSDVNERLAVQEKMLDSYGRTEEEGFIHIPIQQAIKAVAGTLPVRESQSGKTTNDEGLIDSGEPNSGRMFREE